MLSIQKAHQNEMRSVCLPYTLIRLLFAAAAAALNDFDFFLCFFLFKVCILWHACRMPESMRMRVYASLTLTLFFAFIHSLTRTLFPVRRLRTQNEMKNEERKIEHIDICLCGSELMASICAY